MPLPSPATTPCVNNHYKQTPLANIPKQILQHEQVDDVGRARIQESSALPKDFPIDKGGSDSVFNNGLCAQQPSREMLYTPELLDQGTPALTHPSHDLNLMHSPVAVHAKQVYHLLEP